MKIGYKTFFDGGFKIKPELDDETIALLGKLHDGDTDKNDDTPKYWCGWYIEDKDYLTCEVGKNYNSEEWLFYIVNKVLKPKGYTLNGEIHWDGDDSEDKGRIDIKDNEIEIYDAEIIYKLRK
jgi:hypothetical protein